MGSWRTAAICDYCWQSLSPGRDPFRVLEKDSTERCHYCGGPVSGIYIRVEVTA